MSTQTMVRGVGLGVFMFCDAACEQATVKLN